MIFQPSKGSKPFEGSTNSTDYIQAKRKVEIWTNLFINFTIRRI